MEDIKLGPIGINKINDTHGVLVEGDAVLDVLYDFYQDLYLYY